MRIQLSKFVKTFVNQKEEFSSRAFKNKNKSLILNLFESLMLIQKTGKNKYQKYEKTEFFIKEISKIKNNFTEHIIELLLTFIILNKDNLPNKKYIGKHVRSQYKSGARIVTYLLFQTGLLHKQKRTYEYSKLFFHLNQLNLEKREEFFNALVKYQHKKEQQLYLSCFRSIKYKPDHLIISFDHGISLRTQWVLNNWETGKIQNKELKLFKLAEKNKKLIMFEGDRSTKTAKAFITIFPQI